VVAPYPAINSLYTSLLLVSAAQNSGIICSVSYGPRLWQHANSLRCRCSGLM